MFLVTILDKTIPVLCYHYDYVRVKFIIQYQIKILRIQEGSLARFFLSVFYDYCLETNNNDQCLQIIGFDQKVNEILIMCLNSCLTATNHGRFWNELFFPQYVAISPLRHLAFQQVDTRQYDYKYRNYIISGNFKI